MRRPIYLGDDIVRCVLASTRDYAGPRREGEGPGRCGVQGAESAVGRAETHVVSTPGYSESSEYCECREYPLRTLSGAAKLRRGESEAFVLRGPETPTAV